MFELNSFEILKCYKIVTNKFKTFIYRLRNQANQNSKI